MRKKREKTIKNLATNAIYGYIIPVLKVRYC
jgi:hypothetical protein